MPRGRKPAVAALRIEHFCIIVSVNVILYIFLLIRMWLMLFGLFTHAVFDAWFDQLGDHTNDSCAMPTLRRPVSAAFAQFTLWRCVMSVTYEYVPSS